MLTKIDQALVILRICKRAGWSHHATVDRLRRYLGVSDYAVGILHAYAVRRLYEESQSSVERS